MDKGIAIDVSVPQELPPSLSTLQVLTPGKSFYLDFKAGCSHTCPPPSVLNQAASLYHDAVSDGKEGEGGTLNSTKTKPCAADSSDEEEGGASRHRCGRCVGKCVECVEQFVWEVRNKIQK